MDAYLLAEAPAAHRVASANYHPTIWGDHFLAYSSQGKSSWSKAQEHEELKGEVRKMVIGITPDKSVQKLDLIDAIQRLGVSYHFETEIEASMQSIYEAYDDGNDEHLHTVALRFRLLRQHGYNVSSDVFRKFKDSEGNFKQSLVKDIAGLLSLYEATNYRVHEEDVLEEALSFATSQLELMLPNMDSSLTIRVRQALDTLIHKTLTRMGTRQFMTIYQQDKSHDPLLLNFAKLDFKILQKLHQEELSGVTKWWKGLDCPNKMPFARDRVAECYLWFLGVYFEPKYSFARTTMAKVIALTSLLDDIYDVYGTFDHLLLLTEAIQRWDISCLDQLPEYMKPC